jgi:hypothetical protein
VSPTGGVSATFVAIDEYLAGSFRRGVYNKISNLGFLGVFASSDEVSTVIDNVGKLYIESMERGAQFNMDTVLSIEEAKYNLAIGNETTIVGNPTGFNTAQRQVEILENGDYFLTETQKFGTSEFTTVYKRVSKYGEVLEEATYRDTGGGSLVINGRVYSRIEGSKLLGKVVEDVKAKDEDELDGNRCFAAGTLIDMADGTQKPIETIEVGDEVLAYDPDTTDGLGTLKPARVARTMTNFVDEIIDFHGVKMTPGHATLCAEGPNKGQHIPLMDIIREDGVIADRDGTLIRAATNLPVGSTGDQKLQVAYILNKSQQTYFKGSMRFGTLMVGDDDKADWRIMDALAAEGYQVMDDGLIAKDGEAPHPLYWYGEVPKPEDYILKKSALTLADLYAGNGALKSGAPTHAGMTVQ